MTKEEAGFSDRVAPPTLATGRVTGGTMVRGPPLEGNAEGAGRGCVDEPMMISLAEGAREIGVLFIVTGAPPGAMVVLPIPKADAPEPMGVRATAGMTVDKGGAAAGGGGMEETTNAVPDGAREMTWLDPTVTGGPPGVSVVLSGPITMGLGCAAIVCEPTTTDGTVWGGGGGGGGGGGDAWGEARGEACAAGCELGGGRTKVWDCCAGFGATTGGGGFAPEDAAGCGCGCGCG